MQETYLTIEHRHEDCHCERECEADVVRDRSDADEHSYGQYQDFHDLHPITHSRK